MDSRPPQPPEGRLIADALERSGMSIRQASKKAGISYGRWRQIATGVQTVSPGSWAQVRGPAKTVARMAQVVGVSADELRAAGREDVAEVMEASPSQAAPADIEALSEREQELVRAFLQAIRSAPAEQPGEEATGG